MRHFCCNWQSAFFCLPHPGGAFHLDRNQHSVGISWLLFAAVSWGRWGSDLNSSTISSVWRTAHANASITATLCWLGIWICGEQKGICCLFPPATNKSASNWSASICQVTEAVGSSGHPKEPKKFVKIFCQKSLPKVCQIWSKYAKFGKIATK